jgi:hypothetical protein
MEKLLAGFKVIFAAKGEAPAGLWPPQPGKNKNNEERVIITHTPAPKRKLPMHPLVASQLELVGEPLNGMENF